MTHLMVTDEIQTIFPYIKDKIIVDWVNGLDVARELNAIQKQRENIGSRLRDWLSGSSQKRQDNINDHTLAGLEAVREMALELSKDTEHHAVALAKFARSLEKTQSNVTQIVHFVADFKQEMQRELVDIKDVLCEESRLSAADRELSRQMDRWEAGRLNHLAPLQRAYAVLDALYWGAFGEQIRLQHSKHTQEFLEHLQNKLMIQLKRDLGVAADQDVNRKEWLRLPETVNADGDIQKVLSYQGDWCLPNPNHLSTTFTATQWLTLPENMQAEYKNASFHILDSERVSKRLIRDMFEERQS